jgi:predicted nucleotidyltransferase
MFLSDDMKELLKLFNQNEVRYVLVGGFAVNYYGYVRATQDIDILVIPSPENAARVAEALADFGFGGAGIPTELFEQPGGAVHLGAEPNRIDLLTGLKGVDSDEILSTSKEIALDGVPTRIISFDLLIRVKRASDRPRDRADADELIAMRSDDTREE